DTFEDAADAQDEAPGQPASPPLATRSLIERQPSSSSTTTPADRNSLDSYKDSESTETGHKPTEESEADESEVQKGAQKSPNLTSHRISVSSLDDVNLEGGDPGPVIHEAARVNATPKSNGAPPAPPPKLPTREPSASSQKSHGLSGPLPSVPWGPPPVPEKTTAPPPPPPTRKLTGPFAWLSRNTSAPAKEVSSPPTQAVRRNTASSLATLGSNPELTLSRIDDGHESDASSARRPGRNSLRDRFKFLRMREEAGITSLEEETIESPNNQGGALAGLIGRSASVGLGIGSPTSLADEKEGGLARSPGPSPMPNVPSVNTNLAPGTVSGVSAGPSAMTDPAAPVDWDLWQSVVYEGPAAVARSSADELSRAIASGIPSALRGVIWQVLAQSKNEELEGVYRDLVIRGTDKEKALEKRKGSQPTPNSTSWNADSEGSSPQTAGTGKEKESLASSASSMHSETSTPATTASNGLVSPPPTHEKDPDALAKDEARRKQRAKEDAAALQKLEKTIKRDLGSRTSFSKYAMSAGLQDGLFGVCKAYALFDDEVGYAQGMNFLAMPLLFNMPEEEAFCLLVRLMNQYRLRDMFVHDMPGLHLHLYQFERLLEDLEPALYCHLHRRGVNPELYATQWFLTLFAYRFPLQLVLRVYDLVLSEGLEGAILKFGIALMQKNAEALLGMNDMVALSSFLKEKIFDVYIDKAPSPSSILESGFFGSSGGADKEVYRADVLVRDACAVKVTPEMLKTYTHEWEEKVRSEKEREAELESLKSSNIQLSHKVRSLEERTEKFDTEHVQVASELVRTKVEKEELKDENEALRNEIEELKALVERQPAEVEQRLKEEMDRLMQRNLEVHNENQSLEEQMSEMEKDLVDTKVQFAELNSNHETLKQKWSDLRKVLDD
ncbi:RabGAP/TBC, partial [Xylona heveae TC161]